MHTVYVECFWQEKNVTNLKWLIQWDQLHNKSRQGKPSIVCFSGSTRSSGIWEIPIFCSAILSVSHFVLRLDPSESQNSYKAPDIMPSHNHIQRKKRLCFCPRRKKTFPWSPQQTLPNSIPGKGITLALRLIKILKIFLTGRTPHREPLPAGALSRFSGNFSGLSLRGLTLVLLGEQTTSGPGYSSVRIQGPRGYLLDLPCSKGWGIFPSWPSEGPFPPSPFSPSAV